MKRSLCTLLTIVVVFVLPPLVTAKDCPDGVVIDINVGYPIQYRVLQQAYVMKMPSGWHWSNWKDVGLGPNNQIAPGKFVHLQVRVSQAGGGFAELRDNEIQSCRYAVTGSEDKQQLFIKPQ